MNTVCQMISKDNYKNKKIESANDGSWDENSARARWTRASLDTEHHKIYLDVNEELELLNRSKKADTAL